MILFIDANNAPNIVPIAEACEEAGVYWSAAWNAPEGVLPTDYDHWVTFQSCDAVEQGYVIAKTLFESFPTPGQGKICVLEGLLANNANTDRMKGLKKALDEYPGIEVLDDQAGDWETGKALTITENWIAKYGEEMTGHLVRQRRYGHRRCAGAQGEGLEWQDQDHRRGRHLRCHRPC